ncbi:MAG: hypothetical protein V2A73_03030 [Pseudomonadota bacterium]
MTRMRAITILVLVGCCTGWLVAGCFSPSKPRCAFLCGEKNECPSGYQCGPDKRCHLLDKSGALQACDDDLADAEPKDGATTLDGAGTGDGATTGDSATIDSATTGDSVATTDSTAGDAGTRDAAGSSDAAD